MTSIRVAKQTVCAKSNEQRKLACFAMTSKRVAKQSVYVKPNEQSELAHFAMASKRVAKQNAEDHAEITIRRFFIQQKASQK